MMSLSPGPGESAATGNAATAFGWRASATGERAHAFGHLATADGDGSLSPADAVVFVTDDEEAVLGAAPDTENGFFLAGRARRTSRLAAAGPEPRRRQHKRPFRPGAGRRSSCA